MLLSNNAPLLAPLGAASPQLLPSALVSTQMEVTAVLCQIIVGVMVNIGPPVVTVVCNLLFVAISPSWKLHHLGNIFVETSNRARPLHHVISVTSQKILSADQQAAYSLPAALTKSRFATNRPQTQSRFHPPTQIRPIQLPMQTILLS